MNLEAPPEDLLRYDILTQEALLGVIKRVLDEVSKTGLPGEHHFFITFDTQNAGVQLSDRMRERYPEEMTIVIQHTFWDLTVNDQRFEIDLSFDDIRERLSIPFAAVKGFFDPSVKFGLQFDLPDVEAAPESEVVTVIDTDTKLPKGKAPAKVAPREVAKVEKPEKPTKAKKAKAKKVAVTESEDPPSSADVVSLDAFRKKK